MAAQFFRRPVQFLLVCTDDFERIVFVNLRRGSQAARLHKLVVERARPTRHAVDVLEQLAHTAGGAKEAFDQQCKAFNVTEVTNAFYRKYAELVREAEGKIADWNRGSAEFHDAERVSAFTQRLFSRLLFLYFLQKKRWLAGRVNFLDYQYRRVTGDNENFYREVLVPLFYEVLNQERDGDQSDFGRIPYLNGGLFERQAEDDRIFIGNELFDPGIEQGILGFLNQYDFTIEEDTPAEVEVALDPEMLGKVFENLLEERERGKSGVFYTPRSIVHYMCRESLLIYLRDRTGLAESELRELFQDQEAYKLGGRHAGRVEDVLEGLRVLDPAVGSGAFLVGMLQTLVQVRRSCKVALQASAARTGPEVARWKREFIQRSLYGVDIKAEAVEIARLRLWLSLVVDLDVQIGDIEPLPNLDFHVRQGNSLLEGFENGQGLQGYAEMPSQEVVGLRRRLADARAEYFAETRAVQKGDLRRTIEESEVTLARQWLSDRLAELRPEAERRLTSLAGERGGGRSSAAQLGRLNERIARYQGMLDRLGLGELPVFSYRLNFSEVFEGTRPGFDIVIANPPYVRVQDVNGLDYKDDLERTQGWLDDLYAHFLFRGFELATERGVLAYITADTYFTIGTKQRVRNLLLDHELLALARCDPFKATVDTAVVIARRAPAAGDDRLFFVNGNGRPEGFDDLGPEPTWREQREVAVNGDTLAVSIGPADPLPQYAAPVALYRKALKRAIFEPSVFNLSLYERFMPTLTRLVDEWWTRIATSAAARKNADALNAYRAGLRPGDITLLGLVTEGGQGLATADNPRFLAHLAGTRWGEENERRLQTLEQQWQRDPGIWGRYQELLKQMPRYEAVDQLRRDLLGRREERLLGIGRMTLYRTVDADQVVDPSELAEDEKRNGIVGPRCWVPFRKGDREGNRWLSDEPLFIRWDRETVQFFQENSGKKGANMPVVRNPQMYFQPMISWTTVGRDAVVRARLQPPAVFDHGTPTVRSGSEAVPNEILLAVLNSPFSTRFCKAFLNNTKFELNDLRMLPIVVPNTEQRDRIAGLVRDVMDVQRRVLAGEAERAELAPIETAINEEVLALYGIVPAEAPADWTRGAVLSEDEIVEGNDGEDGEASKH